LPQAVPRQVFGARQSAVVVATVQLILQAETPSHRYGLQGLVVAALQLPTPSQVRGVVKVEAPVGQLPATHWVPIEYRWQLPLPSHVPSVPQVDAAVVVQRASSVAAGTFEQMPSVVAPGNAHDLHVPRQALAQQTPCSQKPVAHSLSAPQPTPLALSTQAVPLQTAGDTQSVELVAGVQLVLQTPLAVSHASRPGQVPVVAGEQVPAPSQVRCVVKVAPVQAAATHTVVAA
jgi:hypothetical protein